MRHLERVGDRKTPRIGRFGSYHENSKQKRAIDSSRMSHVLASRESGGTTDEDDGRGRRTRTTEGTREGGARRSGEVQSELLTAF
jgi:hypothetical protein